MNLLKTAYYAAKLAFPTGWKAFKLVFKNFPSIESLPDVFTVDIDIEIHMEISEVWRNK